MVNEQMIARINELAKKQKADGLTPEEAAEQKELRQRYINAFKRNLKSQLDQIRFVDQD